MGSLFSSTPKKFTEDLTANQIFDYETISQNINNPSLLDAVNKFVSDKNYLTCPDWPNYQKTLLLWSTHSELSVCAFYGYFLALIHEKNCRFAEANKCFEEARKVFDLSGEKHKYLDQYLRQAHERCQSELKIHGGDL